MAGCSVVVVVVVVVVMVGRRVGGPLKNWKFEFIRFMLAIVEQRVENCSYI